METSIHFVLVAFTARSDSREYAPRRTAHIINCSRKIPYLRMTKHGRFIWILEALTRNIVLVAVVQRVNSASR